MIDTLEILDKFYPLIQHEVDKLERNILKKKIVSFDKEELNVIEANIKNFTLTLSAEYFFIEIHHVSKELLIKLIREAAQKFYQYKKLFFYIKNFNPYIYKTVTGTKGLLIGQYLMDFHGFSSGPAFSFIFNYYGAI